MKIEQGWRFCTADFSIQASGEYHVMGGVTLIRSPEEKEKWHKMTKDWTEEQMENTDYAPLYVCGQGLTVEDAINNANMAARAAKKIICED
jgi:hypothetical protein